MDGKSCGYNARGARPTDTVDIIATETPSGQSGAGEDVLLPGKSRPEQKTVDAKNYFREGDTLELICPAGNQRFELKNITNKNGKAVQEAPGSGHVVTIPLPEDHGVTADGGHALLMRYC